MPKYRTKQKHRKEKTEDYWTSVWLSMATVVRKPDTLSFVPGGIRKIRVLFRNDSGLVWNTNSQLHVISDCGIIKKQGIPIKITPVD